jgi:hypothetical protein
MPTYRPHPATAALALLALLAAAPAFAAELAGADSAAATAAAAAAAPAPALALPLLLDPSDLGFGSSVLFSRVPDAADIEALSFYDNVRHVVVALPEWPGDWSRIAPLGQVRLPDGADLIVVLRGYPPSRASAAAWNMLRQPLRIVMLVDGPPDDRGMILELNALRGLERVIADMAHPARTGFERLQRPLSFRVVMR